MNVNLQFCKVRNKKKRVEKSWLSQKVKKCMKMLHPMKNKFVQFLPQTTKLI